jgi:hypothetical protein
MKTLLFTAAGLLLLGGFLWLRFLRRFRFQSRNAGTVQRIRRQPPPPPPVEAFLPGSRLADRDTVHQAAEEMRSELHIERIPPSRKTRLVHELRRIDMRRAYMVDMLLDKPKWKQPWNPEDY